jgi:hypothetical protein
MQTSELLRKVRRIEIRTSRLVSDVLAGQFRSAFKGRGMEFEEVRPYQYGDDVRSIDWNVSARTGFPHVKLFREERELTVMLRSVQSAARQVPDATVRLVEHHGHPGLAVFAPPGAEPLFAAWQESGREANRSYMLLVPSGAPVTTTALLPVAGLMVMVFVALEPGRPVIKIGKVSFGP